jgi:hypothetical protein
MEVRAFDYAGMVSNPCLQRVWIVRVTEWTLANYEHQLVYMSFSMSLERGFCIERCSTHLAGVIKRRGCAEVDDVRGHSATCRADKFWLTYERFHLFNGHQPFRRHIAEVVLMTDMKGTGPNAFTICRNRSFRFHFIHRRRACVRIQAPSIA